MPSIDCSWKINRCKQDTPALQRVIPMPCGKDIATWRRNVMRWRPNPIRLRWQPVSSPPNILSLDPVHAGWDPNRIWRRSNAQRLQIASRWRSRQIFNLFNSSRRPETSNPFPAARHLGPVPWNPRHFRWRDSPAGTHPDVSVPVCVPRPISGNPHILLSLRSLTWRDFLNSLRRTLRRNQASLLLKSNRLGKGLMYWAATQNLRLLLGGHRWRIVRISRSHLLCNASIGHETS